MRECVCVCSLTMLMIHQPVNGTINYRKQSNLINEILLVIRDVLFASDYICVDVIINPHND